MSNFNGLSELRIPDQNHSTSAFDTRPKQIAAWLAGLPLGDSQETSKQLYSALSHLNRVQLSPGTRLRTLQALDSACCETIASLKKGYSTRAFPLSQRALKTVDRAIALQSELCVGYKIATRDLAGRNRLLEKRAMACAIHSSITLLKDILLTHYQIYAPEPPLIWTQLHTLYQLAVERKLHHYNVRDCRTETPEHRYIEKQYLHTLLLSLANPYHLGNGQIERVDQFLIEWAEYARILDPSTTTTGSAYFAINLNSDRAPLQLGLIKTLDTNNSRLIDCHDLVQHLQFLISQGEQDSSDSSDQAGADMRRQLKLLRQLMESWESRGKRSFSRVPGQGSVDISLGLNSTHHLLEAGDSPMEASIPELPTPAPVKPDFIDDTANPLEITHTTFSIAPLPDSEDDGQYSLSTQKPRSPSMDQERNKPQQIDYQSQPWKTLNVGAGGYCLLWDHDRSSNAQIGEVVGIREETNDGSHWRIGVVRWMQYLRHQGVKLGIQILSPHAEPMQSRLLNARASRKQEYSCLSLPEIRSMQEPASLLTPPMQYKVGDALLLNDNGRLMNVELTRLVEYTGNFARFYYTPIEQENSASQPSGSNSSGWTQLW